MDIDGETDLVLAPTNINWGAERPIQALVEESGSIELSPLNMDVPTTGSVKEWFLSDVNNDGLADLLLADTGLELFDDFQLGYTRALLGDGINFNGIDDFELPKAFYHAGAIGDFNGD